jgi:hypothetical protein
MVNVLSILVNEIQLMEQKFQLTLITYKVLLFDILNNKMRRGRNYKDRLFCDRVSH